MVSGGRAERRRSETSLRKKAVTLACVLAIIALVVGSLFGDRGILQLLAQRQKVEDLRRQLEDLRSENARLAAEIAALRREPAAIERIAREQLGLVRPGETVFLIHEETRPEP